MAPRACSSHVGTPPLGAFLTPPAEGTPLDQTLGPAPGLGIATSMDPEPRLWGSLKPLSQAPPAPAAWHLDVLLPVRAAFSWLPYTKVTSRAVPLHCHWHPTWDPAEAHPAHLSWGAQGRWEPLLIVFGFHSPNRD